MLTVVVVNSIMAATLVAGRSALSQRNRRGLAALGLSAFGLDLLVLLEPPVTVLLGAAPAAVLGTVGGSLLFLVPPGPLMRTERAAEVPPAVAHPTAGVGEDRDVNRAAYRRTLADLRKAAR